MWGMKHHQHLHSEETFPNMRIQLNRKAYTFIANKKNILNSKNLWQQKLWKLKWNQKELKHELEFSVDFSFC